jgi:hypothetical protein
LQQNPAVLREPVETPRRRSVRHGRHSSDALPEYVLLS